MHQRRDAAAGAKFSRCLQKERGARFCFHCQETTNNLNCSIRGVCGKSPEVAAYDIAWYEQKAVLVLLSLLYLDVKQIRLGPTLPAFLTPNVIKVLVEKFALQPMGSVEEDLAAITGVGQAIELV